jgi:hypothetical protein
MSIKNKSIYQLLLLAFITLNSCTNKGTLTINNLKSDTVIVVPLKFHFVETTTVKLNIKGVTQDTCSLGDFLVLPKGEIDTSFSYDWYDDTKFVLNFHKLNSKSSSMVINYYVP